MLTPTEKIWHNGKFIDWDDARIHVLSHVVSYGSSVFEGIRCYETTSGPAIFRLREHVRRLMDSAHIYRMDSFSFTASELADAMLDLVSVNRMRSCYLRPIVLRGYGDLGVNPLKNPVDVYVACWEWGKYLGEEALSSGADVCISSWTRLAPNTLPTLAKAGANYMNSQLIRMEAIANGYTEGIALDSSGNVSEGSGENIFVIRDGRILTPPIGSSVLPA
jgi:branched-chain amino acid aminotransferase